MLKVTVSDADSGVNGDFDLNFVSLQSKFVLTQSGKLGHVILAQSLDFDRGDMAFTLEIRATGQLIQFFLSSLLHLSASCDICFLFFFSAFFVTPFSIM